MKFSNHFLQWVLSYINGRRQILQVDDKTSELIDTKFGVPLGSILGPVLFKLYVNDHDEVHDCAPFQSADDTTLITHCIPSKLDIATAELNNTIEWFSKRTGTTSGDGVAGFATSLGRHLVGLPVLIKTPWICLHQTGLKSKRIS